MIVGVVYSKVVFKKFEFFFLVHGAIEPCVASRTFTRISSL
jgi:hypothetical protein